MDTQEQHKHFPKVCRDETKKAKASARAKLEKDMRYNEQFCVGIMARESKARKCVRERVMKELSSRVTNFGSIQLRNSLEQIFLWIKLLHYRKWVIVAFRGCHNESYS